MTQEAGGVHYLFALEIARAQVRSRQPNPIPPNIPPNKVPVATCSLRCLVLDEREKQKVIRDSCLRERRRCGRL